jgi:myo-inositol 2-dehydrogenase/D-chiro-inositol 1-dehydrogenase
VALLRLGLIGCGRHGARYASHLLAGDVPGASLVAICRRDARAGKLFAEAHGVRFCPDAAALAGDAAVDGVIVCLPPDLHPGAVLAALSAGRPVLVEKPLAANAARAREIERASAGKLVMVAQTLRFNSVVRAMKERAGDLGGIHGFSASQRYEPLPMDWVSDPDRGGALRVTGVHGFDLARHLTGAEVVRVSCDADAPGPGEADRAFAALLRLEPGPVLATVDNTRMSDGRSGRLELVGRNGSLAGDHVRGELLRLSGTAASPLGVDPPVPTVRECLRAFVAAARGEIAVPITAADGRRAVEISEACRLSAAAGRAVSLGVGPADETSGRTGQ